MGVPRAGALPGGEKEAPPVAGRQREGEAEALGEPEDPTPDALRWALPLGVPVVRWVALAKGVAQGEALPWALEKVGGAVAVPSPLVEKEVPALLPALREAVVGVELGWLEGGGVGEGAGLHDPRKDERAPTAVGNAGSFIKWKILGRRPLTDCKE